MDKDLRTKRETLIVAALLVLGSLAIIYPFLDAILLAVAVSYILAFAHKKLDPYIGNEVLSSVIITFSVLGLVFLSIYFFVNNFFDILAQFNVFTGSLQENILSALEPLGLPESFLDSIEEYLSNFSNTLTNYLIDIFVSLPAILIDVGIFLVTAIFLYKDRSKISSKADEVLNSLPETKEHIIRSLIDSIHGIFQGVFITQAIVAIILGIVAAAGFYIIGVLTTPIDLLPIWVILIMIASLLPLVANFMFYMPLGLYYLILGAEPVKGILIISFGIVFLQILPELLLRPWVGSKSLDEHPLIIFLGFLAGPLVLGVKGLILGPLILILTKQFAFNYADLVSDSQSENHS